ncbi:MAG: caspase family protein, partial [Alphaproteobacteria bacterium]|nr:caspase family protein [Alphaproteobacteria bacterium]
MSASAADAELRVALVIGNGAYQAGAALANPLNDARAMTAKLKALGFDVVAVENGTQQSMRRAI